MGRLKNADPLYQLEPVRLGDETKGRRDHQTQGGGIAAHKEGRQEAGPVGQKAGQKGKRAGTGYDARNGARRGSEHSHRGFTPRAKV